MEGHAMRGRKAAWVLGVTAVAAMVTAGAVYASSNGASSTPTTTASKSVDLHSILVPAANHPAGNLIEQSLAEFNASANKVPAGVVYSPASCLDWLGVAYPGLYNNQGYIQYTEPRWDGKFDANRHGDFYINQVINVPGGVDVNKLDASARTCASGTITLEGKVVGSISYTKVAGPNVAGAASTAQQINISFPQPKSEEEAALLKKYGFGAGTQAIKEAAVVAEGNGTLIYVLSPDAGFALEMASTLHNRAQGISIQ
jgi:hypothetical protein